MEIFPIPVVFVKYALANALLMEAGIKSGSELGGSDGLGPLLCSLQCNNPKTKEPKLAAAARIVSEWTKYDTEIKQFLRRVEEEKGQQPHGQPAAAQDSRGESQHQPWAISHGPATSKTGTLRGVVHGSTDVIAGHIL